MIHKPDSKYKHFSFILSNNQILSIGYNNIYKTHPLAEKYGHRFCATHAEINAIAKFPYAPRHLMKYDMINIRLNKNGCTRLSKPCRFCQLLLAAFHIPQVYYSIDEQRFDSLYLS